MLPNSIGCGNPPVHSPSLPPSNLPRWVMGGRVGAHLSHTSTSFAAFTPVPPGLCAHSRDVKPRLSSSVSHLGLSTPVNAFTIPPFELRQPNFPVLWRMGVNECRWPRPVFGHLSCHSCFSLFCLKANVWRST